jgi:MFS family permease
MLALIGAFLTGLGCSLIFPAMGREVVGMIQPHLRGAALGAFIAFQDLAYGLTGPLAGLLADRAGYASVYLVGSVSAVTGLLIALFLRQAKIADFAPRQSQS